MDNEDGRLQRWIVRTLLLRISDSVITEGWCRLLYFGGLRPRAVHVLLIFICNRMTDTLGSVMHSHMAYYYSVTCYINPSEFRRASWYVRNELDVS